MQKGALSACREAHYELLIHPCDYRKKHVTAALKSLIEETRPAGIIVAAPLSNMPKIIDAIASTDTPFVRLSPGKRNGKQLSIATNDREASAEMMRYLTSLGHTRIAFITGHPRHKAVANRFRGYQDGLHQSDLTFSEQLVVAGDNSFGSGEAAATELLGRTHPPTAIFAANDDMAVGVIRVADRLDIDIPGRLSVVGFDDIVLARQVYPALTTIRQPLATMAERAAQSLIRDVRKEFSSEGMEVVPATLQIRESTGPAPDQSSR
jgi:LacI family transcriptional regulator